VKYTQWRERNTCFLHLWWITQLTLEERKVSWWHKYHVVYKVSVSCWGWWEVCYQEVCKCLKGFVYGGGQEWLCATLNSIIFLLVLITSFWEIVSSMGTWKSFQN
jgi:hypothetical protein